MGRIHDVLLMYSKGTMPTSGIPLYSAYEQEYIESVPPDMRMKTDIAIRRSLFMLPYLSTIHFMRGRGSYLLVVAIGRTQVFIWSAWIPKAECAYSRTGMPRYKIFLDEKEGRPLHDMWTDISPVHMQPKERLGFLHKSPKPSSNASLAHPATRAMSSLTRSAAAAPRSLHLSEPSNRRCRSAVDITHLAITLIRHRLQNALRRRVAPLPR